MAAKRNMQKWTKSEKKAARRELDAWVKLRKAQLAEQIRKVRAGVGEEIRKRRAQLTAKLRAPKPGAQPPRVERVVSKHKKAARPRKKRAARAARAPARASKKKGPKPAAAAAAPAALLEQLPPAQQAEVILEAAELAEPFIEGSRRFIASVWDVLRKKKRTRLDLEAFKQLLVELSKQDFITITRLDLVGAADKRGQRQLMDRSQTLRHGYGGHFSEYHLIAMDRKRGR